MTYKVYFASAGVPATGLTLAWEYMKLVSDGSDVGSPPSFTEVGGGWYKFSYTAAEDIVGVIDGDSDAAGGLANSDRYVPVLTTADDANISNLDAAISAIPIADAILDEAQGDHVAAGSVGKLLDDLKDEAYAGKVVLSPSGDTLTLYKADGVTVLKVFDLTKATGTVPVYIARTPQ